MSVHLQREIERIKSSLLSLCGLVEDQVQLATRAFLDRDEQLAETVIRRDAEIDHREVDLEEECLKTLALHQPVAIDLRFVVAALKINNDLERIGDLAVNIARKALAFAREPYIDIPFDVSGMSEKTQEMLRDAIDALVNLDAQLADRVCHADDEVDALKREYREATEALIRREPQKAPAYLRLLAVTRNLERIADCATNIAEDVIYMVVGKIIRHGRIAEDSR
mgnify:CR=1 FL=1